MRISTISALLVGLSMSFVNASDPTFEERDEDRNHARDFYSISERHTKHKTVTVEIPVNTVNSTTTASFQASEVKNGSVVFVWVSEKPETLIGAYFNTTNITAGMTEIENAVDGKTVDNIVVEVPKNHHGEKNFHAIKKAFSAFTKTKAVHKDYSHKKDHTYSFWATAGKKGEIGSKTVKNPKN